MTLIHYIIFRLKCKRKPLGRVKTLPKVKNSAKTHEKTRKTFSNQTCAFGFEKRRPSKS